MSEAITVRILGGEDVDLLASSPPDVFDDPVRPNLAAEFLHDPRHHIAAAIAGGRVVGMATAVHYVHPDKPPELWINEVGVATAFQRQGIARRLLQALFEHARTLGCGEAWVLTEHDNAAARGLYADVGGDEQSVAYFTFKLT